MSIIRSKKTLTSIYLFQIGISVIALGLLIIAYIQYSDRIKNALKELDGIADNAEKQIEVSVEVIKNIDGVIESVQNATNQHEKTIDSAIKTTNQISSTISAWEQQLFEFSTISKDASIIFNKYQEQLPIKIPKIASNPKTIKYKLPEILPKTQKIELEYPKSVKVVMSKKGFDIPTSIKVNNEDYSKKILGKIIGFSYPKGIDVGKTPFKINYPSNIDVKNGIKTITVPSTPVINQKDYSFTIPSFKVTHREMFMKEKELLKKTANSLVTMSTSILKTKESLNEVNSMLSEDTISSLESTKQNIVTAGSALGMLHEYTIPKVIEKLSSQKTQLHKSRDVFGVLSGLIPLISIILSILPLWMMVNGIGKLTELRNS